MTNGPTPNSSAAPYRNPSLHIDDRVQDLLDRMTIEEKIAQLGSAWIFELLSSDTVAAKRIQDSYPNGLGQITRVVGASEYTADVAARVANEIQRQFVHDTRLGIPVIVHEEICSGLMGRGSTVFPQAIGVASTFDPSLNEAIADAIRAQMRSTGAHQGLSPVLDVCRDPRWGRTEETYGEDPYLVARMGSAFVDGLQGGNLSRGVIATAKHFVGYGASEGGLNWAPAHIGDRAMREVFMHPFEDAVREHGLRSIMNGYHELDGVPCSASSKLFNDILRREWGFDGTVVADYFSVGQLYEYHHVAPDRVDAAAAAMRAGIDVELPSSDCYAEPLLEALEQQKVDEAMINEAVARSLRLKFELGLFEDPYVDEHAALAAVDTPTHRSLARAVAGKSIVLLRNDAVLPIAESCGSIAVIGPNADEARNLFGDYSYPAHVESLREMHAENNVFNIPIPTDFDIADVDLGAPSVLTALRSRFGGVVQYVKGCGVTDADRQGLAEAVELASVSEVVVLVVGDKAGLTDDCTSGEGRDRSSLDLPGVQEELARAVIDTGTPVITVLVAGRPCGSEYLHENSAAVVMAWLPGQEGSHAIADVLTGVANPGGKLPISFPRSAGQLPVFYGHKISGGRSHWKGDYVDSPANPLYPFGHGLSYTTFALSEAVIEQEFATPNEAVVASVRVTNTGEVAGDEVVQLYIRDPQASVTRPVLELKSFARLGLEPGASSVVRFELPVAQIGFRDRDLNHVIEPGIIEVFIGSSSSDLHMAGSFTVVADPSDPPVPKAFAGSVTVSVD